MREIVSGGAEAGVRVRIVIFADWDHWVPRMLVKALLAVLPDHPLLRLEAVCVARPPSLWPRLVVHGQRRLAGWLKARVLGDVRYRYRQPHPQSLRQLARRHGFEVLVVPDANRTESVQMLRERFQPEVLLSLFWKRKFGASFLQLFEQAVNYHNGSVPDYRGLRATPWSVYRGERRSGFTFHRISEGLDLGNVLVEGSVLIEPEASVLDIELAKTRLAASRWPEVLDAIVNRNPGTPQHDVLLYNRVKDITRLVHIDDLTSLTSTELLRRIRAFGPVRARLGHEFLWLSGLGEPVSGPGPVSPPILGLRDGAWRLKPSDWRAHRLRRVKRWLGRG
jgi:folate-dependent phosphoribosylglycinamide formyltransferase PurN